MALDYVTKQYGKASDKDKLNMILNIIMQNCMSELPVNICSNILIIINSIQRFQLLNEDNCLGSVSSHFNSGNGVGMRRD